MLRTIRGRSRSLRHDPPLRSWESPAMIDRRTFFRASGTAMAGMQLLAGGSVSAGAEAGSKPWKKAFMLGGATEGPILPHFELLKDAGFQGVELISPNKLDHDEVLRARD